jgi:GntR family transcriptional regulator
VTAARRRLRRTTDRYQWEKDRALLPEDERRRAGAAERDTGLAREELEFSTEFGSAPAGAELARRFGVPEGTRMLRRTYRTRARGENAPLSLVISWLVYDMAAANPALLRPENEPWPGGTPHQLSTIGIEIDRVVDEVTVRLPLPEEARTLDVPGGVPVLVLRKTSIDTAGRVVEIAECVLPGDRAEIVSTTRLQPWPKRNR